MNDNSERIFNTTIEVSPSAVYHAFTNAGALNEWLCDDSQVDARENGRLYLYWNEGYYSCGAFTTLVPEQSIAFTWHGRGEPAATAVNIILEPAGGRTHLTLTHSGMGSDNIWESAHNDIESRWKAGLTNLKSVLETGLDRRIFDRPMLGVMLGNVLDAEQAAELGIPASSGVRISGTVPGTGAEAAGLQAGDVLVRLNGVDIIDFQSLGAVITARKAGDTVEVSFYRGQEQYTRPMQLSHRPIPNVPANPGELAAALGQLYEQLDSELSAILDGVSEAEASHVPADGEWNVKEIVAHLIGTERITQIDIALRLSNETGSNYPHNPPAWTRAMTTVYPTLPAILSLWRQTNAETIALINELPVELVSRKATYMNIGNTLLYNSAAHTRTHFTQVQETIAAARKVTG